MQNFPILDNHLHLRPDGGNVNAVLDFQKAGGTHVMLSHMPYPGYRIKSGNDFKDQYEVTLKLAKLVREKTSVKVYTSLGPYPVELLRLEEKIGLEKGKGVMLRGMDIAGKFVEEGQAVALGEIGRPHFPVSEKIMEISNEVMKYGMQLATDIGCAVVLHTESASPEVFKELAELADSVGLPRNKVVKHYSPPIVREEDNYGLFPSVLAGEKAVKEALSKGTRFMLETDFLDDPKRPGAVLGIKTVPKRTKALLEEGILSEDDLLAIHKENPESVYNIKMDE